MLADVSFWLAVGPFIIFLLLLLWKKMPLLYVSAIALIVVLILQIIYWQILPLFLLNSIVKGVLVAFDIFVIIFGAVFFLEVLKDIGIIENVCFRLSSLFKDYRIQIILLAWFFENFIEGSAGFGTPSAIVAPLLITLGLSPINAVIISLLGNSTSTVFGAAGTPIRVGFAGLENGSIPAYGALFNLAGFLVPVFMLWTLISQQKGKTAHFWEAFPFAVWSGIAFVVPSLLFVGLGQEFPSILGSIIGLGLVLVTTRLGILVPKIPRHLRKIENPKVQLPISKLLFPYGLLIFLLIAGKFILGSMALSFPWGYQYNLNLFNPGIAFLATGLPIAFLWGRKQLAVKQLKLSLKRTIEPFLVIAAMSTIAQLLINSGNNVSGLPSSLGIIAKGFEVRALPLLAPFVGAFGSFITGSVTISNIIFGGLLDVASRTIGMDPAKILALGLVGGAAGNMIALADIITAEAVVGLKNQTRLVLKGVAIPCLIYLGIVGIIGILVIGLR